MNVVKTISTSVKNAVRFVKFLRMGKSDVRECRQIGPYGTDSNPIKDMVAIYSSTQEDGKNVIIGYVNKNQIAAEGEHRIFSTDADGAVQMFIHLKNDGTAEFGGDSKNMVRYQELESGISQTDTSINTELGKIATAIAALGGAYTPGVINTDISAAKIEEIKTL